MRRAPWPQRPVRLVGVSAEKTGEDNFEQMDLFTDAARIDKQEEAWTAPPMPCAVDSAARR